MSQKQVALEYLENRLSPRDLTKLTKKQPSQRKLALEALASQGPHMLTKNPSKIEKALSELRIKPISKTLGMDGTSRKIRRRSKRRTTRKHRR